MKTILNNAYADASLSAELARHQLWFKPTSDDMHWLETFNRALRYEAVCRYILRRASH